VTASPRGRQTPDGAAASPPRSAGGRAIGLWPLYAAGFTTAFGAHGSAASLSAPATHRVTRAARLAQQGAAASAFSPAASAMVASLSQRPPGPARVGPPGNTVDGRHGSLSGNRKGGV
jgi:hypothetical protein